MEHAHTHDHKRDYVSQSAQTLRQSHFRLAFSATWHCLLGCGLGEVAGMAIGTALHWDNVSQMALAIVLGFVGGFGLGIVPLLKAGFSWGRAFKQVLVAEGLSIVVMETAEVLTQVYTPGVMHAHITDAIFWLGMLLGLAVGFAAAFPVNYFMIKRGVRHAH